MIQAVPYLSPLPQENFRLFLQPKVDLLTGTVSRAEGLMRFHDPHLGFLPTRNVLSQLEAEGRLMETDFFLFKDLCRNLGNWLRAYGKKISVSVNISRGCFTDDGFVSRYAGVMEHFGVMPELIEIELIENSALEQLDRVRGLVKKLRKAGLRCGLDDFGSGYSSFHILTSIELDELKIDRSLFADPSNGKERVVLRHILETARELGVQTVAEGVEQKEYPALLQGLGCNFVQGYVFYPPMPAEEFEKRFVLGDETVRVER